MAELAELQRRFYRAVVTRADEPGLCTGDLGIYARMYRARLYDVLAGDYPKLRAALGDRFDPIIAAYLDACPPRSFTLRDAGLALPRWLARAATAEAPAWAAQLAALERARIDVFDGPDAAPLTRDEIGALAPDAFAALAIRWIPASQLVELDWTVDELWSALEDGAPPPEPAAAARRVVVWRKDITVVHRTLDPDEAVLAGALADGASIAALSEQLGDPERLVELLLRWLAAEAVMRAEP